MDRFNEVQAKAHQKAEQTKDTIAAANVKLKKIITQVFIVIVLY
jgi:hypothetical protein